ncbi:MAG TPA: DNA repair helicase XPB [Dehalococcoidia bacterium]
MIVQSDNTVLLEVENPLYAQARDALAPFAELEKSPEHIHTYRITPLSLWNARAAGMEPDQMVAALERFSKFDVPGSVVADVRDYAGRYGRLKLEKRGDDLVLRGDDQYLIEEIWSHKELQRVFLARTGPLAIIVPAHERGRLKQALIRIGWPAEDLAGYVEGERLEIALRAETRAGLRFDLRPYQTEAAEAFWAGGTARGGSGVLVLPCGAGKTVIGMAAMAKANARTLILCTSVTAAHQWRDELLDKTSLSADEIGEYSGARKEIKPVTLATYQVMTHIKRDESRRETFPHLELFNRENWGLIIYDEVHLLPAPVFRITAEIQARRRLGLTATLVREDHREDDVFALVGPKRYDVPWRDLEAQGWIATATCVEVRVPLDESQRMAYAVADPTEKFRIASTNPTKEQVVVNLATLHRADTVLVIGQYLEQLDRFAKLLDCPIITGKTPNREREKLYAKFKAGEEKLLVVSKVANFSIDLPDANVAIQASGTFGSRQEEAQRLGRILRPKSDGGQARFYSVVTRDTRDRDFAANRQRFLTEQGYRYEIVDYLPGAGLAVADGAAPPAPNAPVELPPNVTPLRRLGPAPSTDQSSSRP